MIAVTREGRAIHENQTLDLPDLDLAGLRASKEAPTLNIDVYADAFNDGYTFDVDLQKWETKYPDAVGAVSTENYRARTQTLSYRRWLSFQRVGRKNQAALRR